MEQPDYENLRTSLNEMARVNKKETGNEWWNLNFNKYNVYVRGEGSANKFAHCHVKNLENGWDVRVLPDGTVHSIKTRGKGMQNKQDMLQFERITKEWVKHRNAFDKFRSNGETVQYWWMAEN